MEEKSTVSISEGGRPAWVTRGDPPAGLRIVGTEKVFDFGDRERLTIGTQANCEIRLCDDPTVSRVHAIVDRRGGTAIIQDASSRNGTYFSSVKVETAELRDAGILTIGRTHLVVYSEGNQLRLTARERFVGNSSLLLAALDEAERAAFEGRNVLIIGESGTGKTLLARVIHEIARGPKLPFVVVDCGADSVAAMADLFGDTPTAIERASGGTLFVKEPNALSRTAQTRLLEALQIRSASEPASVRIVAATASSPTPLDVLAPAVVRVPPLRDRRADLRMLVELFIEEELGPQHLPFSPATLAAINLDPWPGNVAELHEAVHRLVVLGKSQSKTEASVKLGISRAQIWRWLAKHEFPRARTEGYLW